MGLAGRNQLLATTDFPTGRGLGKQNFTAAETAGTEHPLGKEPARKKTQHFCDKHVTHNKLALFCLKILVFVPIDSLRLYAKFHLANEIPCNCSEKQMSEGM